MSLIVIGVGDCRVSSCPADELVTYALGSCIALAIYDPVAKAGGLLHYMLPDSAIAPNRAGTNPYMFADTAIPLLFQRVCERGAQKNRLAIHAAGGAQVMDTNGVFNIGKLNYAALRRILAGAGFKVHSEAVGGHLSRTVRLEIGSGCFWMRSPGSSERDLALRRDRTGGNFDAGRDNR